MQVSSQTNNYQAMNAYQQEKKPPVTLPIEPNDPKYSAKEIYEASGGNVISDKDGNLVLTPQGQTNLNNINDDKAQVQEAEDQAKEDNTRGAAVDYVAYQSQKSQVEIYLSVATNSKVDLDDGTSSIIESLRDVQKQNNAVEAYATYEENQKGGEAALY